MADIPLVAAGALPPQCGTAILRPQSGRTLMTGSARVDSVHWFEQADRDLSEDTGRLPH